MEENQRGGEGGGSVPEKDEFIDATGSTAKKEYLEELPLQGCHKFALGEKRIA